MFVLPLSHSPLRPFRPALRQLSSAPSLAQVIDRLLDDSTPSANVRTPALDVEETNTHYVLSFDLPGAAKDALKVSVEGRRVRIETQASAVASSATSIGNQTTGSATEPVVSSDAAAPNEAVARDGRRSLYRERSSALFARTVSLPQEVDSDASEAKLEQGVLTLRLAKRRVDGARSLTVN